VPFVNVGRVQRGIYLAAERAAAAVTDGFIDVSVGMRDICIAHKVGRPEQHHVIHSGFDLSRFKAAVPPDDWRAILGIGPDEPKPPTIVMVAAFEARKRHREFLQVFPELLARVPTAKLVMPGSGPLLGEVQQVIRDLKLESSARLIGYRTDVERIIAMADLCLLTSNREGLPRVVMQYLAAGKPCVVSDLPGLDEVLSNGENGLAVPPDDLRAAALECADLLLDRDALHRLAEGARKTDLSSWDVERMCARIENVYAALSQAAGP
jgi:glycosyltransferase involved in cell wall biosynthesis